MPTLFALVIAYLLGSIGFGVVVARLKGVNIYEVGSGNPGTSNVYRSIGKGAAAAVMLGDMAKGLTAAAVGSLLVSPSVGFACGFAAVVGHILPIWHGFRGGRGVATAIGAALWLEPVFGAIIAIGWSAVVIATKTASLASIGAMLALVPGMALFGQRGWALLWTALTSLLVLARHAPNIRRILAGQERKVTAGG